MTPLRVDIWSDIACPWCYVGKRRFERALARFCDGDGVQVVFRSFELNPLATAGGEAGTYSERLARKYRTSNIEAKGMISRMVEVGTGEGIAFDFDRIKSSNTFEGHRLLHFAQSKGLQSAMKEQLFLAYFTRGVPMNDRDALAQLATAIGLDAAEASAALASDAYAKEVRLDEREAEVLGIRGVPFFVIGGRYAISGAQSTEVLLAALERVRHESLGNGDATEGARCEPDRC